MNCTECPSHEVIPDAQPGDWFNQDVAIVCKETPNDKQDLNSKYAADRNPYKVVACAVGPCSVEKEAKVPTWCPKAKEKS